MSTNRVQCKKERSLSNEIQFTRQRPVSTPSILSRGIEKIHVEDPSSQRSIGQSCRISQSTVCTIRKSDNFLLRPKRQVHQLTLSTAEKCGKRALRLDRQLANSR